MGKPKTAKKAAVTGAGKKLSPIGKTRIQRISGQYFHDLDPYTLHGTKAAAQKDRTRLSKMGTGVKSRKPRVATFYTILQDPRKNLSAAPDKSPRFGNVPQGPHIFPHFGIHHGIIRARLKGKLDSFADKVLPTVDEFQKRVDKEIPSTHKKRKRAELAKKQYAKAAKRFDSMAGKKRSEVQDIRFAHTVNKMTQLDPFGSYAYKGSGAGKKALKGKGENAGKPLAQQIDFPKNSGITDTKGAQARSQTLLTELKKLGIK